MRILGNSNINFENIKITDGNGQLEGGGVRMIGEDVTVTLGPGSEVSDNKTANGGKGGGIYVNSSTLNIVSGIIKRNTAYNDRSDTGSGGGVYMNGGAFNMIGGAIGVVAPANVIAEQTTALSTPQTANFWTAVRDTQLADGNQAGNGGGIFITSPDDSIVNVTISSGALIQFNRSNDNAEQHGGGGINVNRNATVTIKSGAKISYNHSHRDGGAGYAQNQNSVIILEDGELSYNRAMHAGGIHPIVFGSLEIRGGKICYNLAAGGGDNYDGGGAGGGICLRGNTIMTGGEIFGNVATRGGGVWLSGDIAAGDNERRYFNMTGGRIYGNVADLTKGVSLHSEGNSQVFFNDDLHTNGNWNEDLDMDL
jgi:hypothetical protein